MDKKQALKVSMDAIVASGKKFIEIPKESFYNFFKGEGIEKKLWEPLYEELSEIYSPKKKKVERPSTSQPEMMSGFVTMDGTHHKVDYYSNTHNDVKKREPRKSIFGEISKIAG